MRATDKSGRDRFSGPRGAGRGQCTEFSLWELGLLREAGDVHSTILIRGQ